MSKNEHEPIHVHVIHGARESIFDLSKYHKNIIDKWVKFFVMKQSVRSTNIKKKL